MITRKNMPPQKKMKFSIKDLFSKCNQIRADLVTSTEEILTEKLLYLLKCANDLPE